jgi:hypothetical protein
LASIRQIVETVYDKLFNTFGLWQERPHELGGLRARLATRVTLHIARELYRILVQPLSPLPSVSAP